MNDTTFQVPLFLDVAPKESSILEEVLLGLTSDRKRLPSKYFYDATGSALFDQICDLDEYYLTRTEKSILVRHLSDIADVLDNGEILVEYGSGSSEKTRLLLDALKKLRAYVPIDISRTHLLETAEQLKQRYRSLEVLPVCADYSQELHLGLVTTPGMHINVFFPGSTIGNFSPNHAIAFLDRVGRLIGSGGGCLIGVDLVKDRAVLEAAYDDDSGVTAAFNKNILTHINERTGSNFDPDKFGHLAFFNEEYSRIEMHLVSLVDQVIQIESQSIPISKDETICTEYSHKYTPDSFGRLADQASFDVEQIWTDDHHLFSVQYLRFR